MTWKHVSKADGGSSELSDKTAIILSLTVITEDENVAVKVWEVVGRAAVGLALEGVYVSTNISRAEDDEEAH
jgi:hypothetical protein